MIDAIELHKSYGSQALLCGASFNLSAGEHLALVGPNGSGKTTLLRILAGEETLDSGQVQRPRGLRVGYLRQEMEVSSDAPLVPYVEDVVVELRDLEAEIHEIGGRLGQGEADAQLLVRYGQSQTRFEHLGGYRLRAEAERILAGLGFAQRDFQRPVSTFSGGWKMRGALARILLSQPDLVLLDEPTNHLDIVSLEWLEEYLQESQSATLIVSHDVAFLDRVVGGVLALEAGKVVRTRGGYSAYVADRALREAQAQAASENDQRRRAEAESFIERFRYKATKARQVQSRIKRLEREEASSLSPRETRTLSLNLPQPPRCGRTVVTLEGVTAGYRELPIYRGLDFRIDREERVVFIGPNGAGKSTLLKILAGQVLPTVGRVVYGHNVTLSYFAQHQLEQLDSRHTVLEEMTSLPGLRSELELRRILGAFLFSGEAVDKRVEVLSGGEKSRLVLAKILASPGNFLLMDEPTNHLDIQACGVLKDALASYQGTLCAITHDRDLINRVATRVVYVEGGTVRDYRGNYDDFAAKRAVEVEEVAKTAVVPGAQPEAGRLGRREQRRLEAERRSRIRRETAPLRFRVEELESRVSEAEARLSELDAVLADPATYVDARAAAERAREQVTLRRRLEELSDAWETAAMALEEAEARWGEG